MKFFNHIRLALLAAWLGAAIYFSVVVAPSVFGVLRSFSLGNAGEIAGAIVTRTLSVVNVSGCVIGLGLILSGFAVQKNVRRASFVFQLVLLFVVTITTALGEWVIAARMRGLRLAMQGQIDALPLTDPNRMAFAKLHGYSVSALGVAMIAALIALFIMARPSKSN